MTESEAKELLELARKAAAGDAQVAELLQRLGSRAHQLQAKLDQAEATNGRLSKHIGRLIDENALLRAEIDGNAAKGGE